MKEQYRPTFTTSPVKDNDLFIVNYVGHPYQGSFYYNSARSQGAAIWQSSFFCLDAIASVEICLGRWPGTTKCSESDHHSVGGNNIG
ncbi:MAG TPA: DUF3943 domain-containing protein [Bacteroidales bacterium]|nr:DUF3943 domain-containing protein [Bacteroidales bacterium]HOQ96977.1 DUF3943 domain-containing protein [Bacteroidales bacterium]HPL85141.1 DUF3943 domain-containing protein [Bacteroidales bacterium]